MVMATSNPDKLTYEVVEGWGKLPEGWKFTQVAGVAVDSRDRVYVYNRGEHPLIIFDREGNFLTSWGEGVPLRKGGQGVVLTRGGHGIFIDADDYVYLADRAMQTALKFTPEGERLLTLGTEGQANEGKPFNNLTDVALSPSGEIYVSDGYGNSLVHRFSADGTLLLSWGEPGSDAGQFKLPHSVFVDRNERVYVADRENHRIQVFTSKGEFITMWTGFRQPTDLFIDADDNLYISELQSRVTIVNLNGEILARLGGEKSDAPGQFIAPHAVWTDSQDSLYVGEVLEGQRIQKFLRR
jgi:DNA-binding beta-propeller fold protein YncE